MHFIDEAKIYLKAGDGGDGLAGFRHEKFVEFGGPDGGDGGRGGSIIFKAVKNLNTLIDFRYKQHFRAEKGENGRKSCCTGAAGKDMIINVPVGTQVFGEDGQDFVVDLITEEQEVVVAKGGKGGLGNTHFKGPVNQAPRKFTCGTQGAELWVWLKLKLLSDVGLLGMPNAGKSTFLSVVSAAKPKIADYQFTTLKPQLGVVYIDGQEFVIADIPGLIEGASQGRGLGHAFLRHIERCTVLLHLIDATVDNVVHAYKTIYDELFSYKRDLVRKEEVIALNKCDLVSDAEIKVKASILSDYTGKYVHLCSGITHFGITEILRNLLKLNCKDCCM
ncbi:GTPase ObgE [Alphaproteobacteria bacterium]